MSERQEKFAEVMDNVDLARAARIRSEYGRVKWLLSWKRSNPRIPHSVWVARLSAPNVEKTVEAIGQSRCLAIDSATRTILDILHRQSAEDAKTNEAKREFLDRTTGKTGDEGDLESC